MHLGPSDRVDIEFDRSTRQYPAFMRHAVCREDCRVPKMHLGPKHDIDNAYVVTVSQTLHLTMVLLIRFGDVGALVLGHETFYASACRVSIELDYRRKQS